MYLTQLYVMVALPFVEKKGVGALYKKCMYLVLTCKCVTPALPDIRTTAPVLTCMHKATLPSLQIGTRMHACELAGQGVQDTAVQVAGYADAEVCCAGAHLLLLKVLQLALILHPG
jgi:hypothetical protein